MRVVGCNRSGGRYCGSGSGRSSRHMRRVANYTSARAVDKIARIVVANCLSIMMVRNQGMLMV